MFFASDNGGPAHPDIMAQVIAANVGHEMSYGNDHSAERVRNEIRRVFEAPAAEVFLVATGTAANALALASYTQPFQTIYCTPVAHIEEDECAAPEFYTGGAKLTLVPGGDKMARDALQTTLEQTAQGDVHCVQRGPVSLTQVTERGGVYSLQHLRDLTSIARDFGCPVHLDGARFANALVATNASPAEMSWKSGVDVLSFGGTKNGCLGVEAVVLFSPDKAWEFELRRKRAGHLFSKHRYLAAQMIGYLNDDLWLSMAKDANANATHLIDGLRAYDVTFDHPPEANMIFARFPRRVHQSLKAAGAQYKLNGVLDGDPHEKLSCRLVCDWSIQRPQIDAFLSHF